MFAFFSREYLHTIIYADAANDSTGAGRVLIKARARAVRCSKIRETYIMEGYNVNGAPVYRKQGSALKAEELQAVICCLCGFILRGAMQVTQCGHRYCKNCIEKVMSEA